VTRPVSARSRSQKGANAEREIAKQIVELTGWPVRRRLQEGRADDTGDLEGIPDAVVQVKNYADIGRAVREALADVEKQRDQAGVRFGVGMIRRPGGRVLVCMDLPTWATYHREATG
jgi:hypothetical protein